MPEVLLLVLADEFLVSFALQLATVLAQSTVGLSSTPSSPNAARQAGDSLLGRSTVYPGVAVQVAFEKAHSEKTGAFTFQFFKG
jgi:hypothetical protein